MTMERFQVTGYDANDAQVFTCDTDAPNEDVAKMYVAASLKANINTVRLYHRTERMEAKRRKRHNR